MYGVGIVACGTWFATLAAFIAVTICAFVLAQPTAGVVMANDVAASISTIAVGVGFIDYSFICPRS